VKGLNLPSHPISFKFFNGSLTRANRPVCEQLPVDLLSPSRRSAFLGMDDGERKFRVLLLFADGRKNPNPAVFDFQDSFRQIPFCIPNPEPMHALDAHFLHFVPDRTFSITRKTIHAGSQQEMCPGRLCGAEKLVEITLTVADMNATLRVAKKCRRLFQVLQPTDTLFLFYWYASWIDLLLERIASLKPAPSVSPTYIA
jgi:hypothetical protein